MLCELKREGKEGEGEDDLCVGGTQLREDRNKPPSAPLKSLRKAGASFLRDPAVAFSPILRSGAEEGRVNLSSRPQERLHCRPRKLEAGWAAPEKASAAPGLLRCFPLVKGRRVCHLAACCKIWLWDAARGRQKARVLWSLERCWRPLDRGERRPSIRGLPVSSAQRRALTPRHMRARRAPPPLSRFAADL